MVVTGNEAAGDGALGTVAGMESGEVAVLVAAPALVAQLPHRLRNVAHPRATARAGRLGG